MRLTRARQLLRKYPAHSVDLIVFTDEKVFTVEAPINAQNNRLYTPVNTTKRHIAAEHLLCMRSTFTKSIMVLDCISKLGSTGLVFVEPGTKVDGVYYRDVVVCKHVLSAIRHFAAAGYTSQQNSAPAHYNTVELLCHETPDFISPDMWLPNSPDLNP